MKKHRDYEDEMNDSTKAKEVTAYEDSWYRSLKALADMRPTETEVRPAPEEVYPAPEEVDPAADEIYPVAEEDDAAADEEDAAAEAVHHRAEAVRSIESDEETAGVPED
ncbi:MAG: hypothetical protein WD965_05215 [Actinomycetota bacterium]